MKSIRTSVNQMISNNIVVQYFEFSRARTITLYADLEGVKAISTKLRTEAETMIHRKVLRVEAICNSLQALTMQWEEILSVAIPS